MIEEEEIFQTAEETGYRCCISDPDSESSSFGRVFYSTWDPNDADSMFTCSQAGQLKTTSCSTGASTTYDLLFRRFQSARSGTQEEPRLLKAHFDKFALIPGRPHEFVFLLGISKTLMYSALPGTSASLAKNTSTHSSEFAYGAPVLELVQHACRITSVGVSHKGNLLATGDEQGNVKVMLLQHFESYDAVRSRLKPGQPALPDNTKVAFKPHDTPVFSVKFLPGVHTEQVTESQDAAMMKYGLSMTAALSAGASGVAGRNGASDKVQYRVVLATGSVDRAVRLWQATYNPAKGIALQPFMALNTVSTHMLCLESALCGTAPPPILPELLGLAAPSSSGSSNADTEESSELWKNQASDNGGAGKDTAASSYPMIGGTLSGKGGGGGGRASHGAVEGEVKYSTDLPEGSSILLAGGTDTGAIYVWRLDPSTFAESFACSATGKNNASGRAENVLDDGSFLSSLLHASDRPIVQVALGTTLDIDTCQEKVVLAASDTCGTVRIHAEVGYNNTDADPDSKAVNTGNVTRDVHTAGQMRPLSIVGEAHYSNPVVFCGFPNAFSSQHVWEHRQGLPRLASAASRGSGSQVDDNVSQSEASGSAVSGDYSARMAELRRDLLEDVKAEVVSRESIKRLMVATADGDVRHYKASALAGLVTSTASAEAAAKAVALLELPSDQDSSSSSSSDDDDDDDDHHFHHEGRGSENGADRASDVDDMSDLIAQDIGAGSALMDGIGAAAVVGTNARQTPSAVPSARTSAGACREANSPADIDPPPRSPGSAPSIVSASAGAGAGAGASASGSGTSVTFAGSVASGSRHSAPASETPVSTPATVSRPSGSDRLAGISALDTTDSPQPRTAVPVPTASVASASAASAVSAAGSITGGSAAGSVAQSSMQSGGASHTLAHLTQPPMDTQPISRTAFELMYAPRGADECTPPITTFAVPTVNSSTAVQGRMASLQREITNADDISVSTIITTETDRRAFANATTNLNPRDRQYGSLPRLDAEAVAAATPTMKKVGKQIDPRWRFKADQLGPTPHDLEILHCDHPQLNIVLSAVGSGAPSPVGPTSASHLRALDDVTYTFDADTLSPTFNLSIPSDFIFGGGGAASKTDAWDDVEAEFHRVDRFQHTC